MPSSVIIEIIDKFHVTTVEPENYPPICLHRYRIKSGSVSSQPVQAPTGIAQIFRAVRHVERRQLLAQTLSVYCLNTRQTTSAKEALKPFMAK